MSNNAIVYIDGQNIESKFARQILDTIYNDYISCIMNVYVHNDDLMEEDTNWKCVSKVNNMNLVSLNSIKYDVTHSIFCDVLTQSIYDKYDRDVIIVSNSYSFEPLIFKLKTLGKNVYGIFTEKVSQEFKYSYNDFYELVDLKQNVKKNDDSCKSKIVNAKNEVKNNADSSKSTNIECSIKPKNLLHKFISNASVSKRVKLKHVNDVIKYVCKKIKKRKNIKIITPNFIRNSILYKIKTRKLFKIFDSNDEKSIIYDIINNTKFRNAMKKHDKIIDISNGLNIDTDECWSNISSCVEDAISS